MQITDNLKNDISNAPSWFHDAINIKPSEKILKDAKGNLSYSVWPSLSENKNLMIFIHGTGAHKKWWYPIAPQFVNYSNVIAVDLPGLGANHKKTNEENSNRKFCVVVFGRIRSRKSRYFWLFRQSSRHHFVH